MLLIASVEHPNHLSRIPVADTLMLSTNGGSTGIVGSKILNISTTNLFHMGNLQFSITLR